MQEVQYYTETSVLSDPLVQEWNRATESRDAPASLRLDLERRLLAFRKPATMFGALKTVQASVTRSENDQTTVQFYTYDRYPDGYDFRPEREWRLAFQEDVEYLSFSEEDLFMVITPDELAKEAVTTHIRTNGWRFAPIVNVFPSA